MTAATADWAPPADWRTWPPERKAALLRRLEQEAEARRTLWACGKAGCNGMPHEGAPVKHGRHEQMQPAGDYLEWLVMAGRGFGKTRTGAEWVRTRVDTKRFGRVALIGRTAADVRDVMIEGESGLLSVWPKWQRPDYQPSKRRVVFHNGAVGFTYSSDEPDQLRGPQHDTAWGDEVSTFKNLKTVLYNLRLGLRLGPDPRTILTGTPRPTVAMKELVKNPLVKVTRGSTYANLGNLADAFQRTVVAQYEGTRVGRQELDGDLLEDVEGALWNWGMYEWDAAGGIGFRPELDWLTGPAPKGGGVSFERVVVAIDPATTANPGSDLSGLAVCALGSDKRGYVLHSEGVHLSPDAMLRRALDLYEQYQADRIIAETNNGGDFVEALLKTVPGGGRVPYRKVTASRGKRTRAEPVVALYEQRRVSHVGHPSRHALLENQQTTWTGIVPSLSELQDGEAESPDVMDAVVWGLTHLMVTRREPPKPRTVQT